MGKAAIQAQINAKQGELADLSSEINDLVTCRNNLAAFSADIEYVLKSHENIKENYYLAGTPYLNETNNEKTILETAKKELSTKKDDTVTKLNNKIAELEARKSLISTDISLLEISKSITKEA